MDADQIRQTLEELAQRSGLEETFTQKRRGRPEKYDGTYADWRDWRSREVEIFLRERKQIREQMSNHGLSQEQALLTKSRSLDKVTRYKPLEMERDYKPGGYFTSSTSLEFVADSWGCL
eukprot:1196969-Amphidinium_carterae.1